MKVRFRFWADATNTDEGWAIDDIEIVDIATPTTPASAVNITAITDNSTTVNWTNGDGQGRLVVARLTSTVAVPPTNDVLKNAIAPTFGPTVDSTGLGNYIVYKNNGSSVAAGGLDIFTYYTYDVYEYNGKYMYIKFTPGASANGSTLPLTLTSFAANVKGADAILTWATASEVNNSGFEVQRSIDGRNFVKAGFVKGAGNSNKTLNYSLTDAKAFAVANSNVVYYRLKQIDFDGKFTYSQIVRVAKNAEAVNALSVYPNPYATSYSVSLTATKEGVATTEMVDLQGKVVATKSASIIGGNNMVPMTEVTNLEAGVYFVRLTVNGETQMTKLVKN